MKISALWITKNEEKTIERTIESVREAADEMVVVDTGSTDDTVKIAERLGVRVEHFDWVGDFSAARNYALSKVDGDVVLFPDADEWFEPALTKADRKTLQAAFDDPKVFSVLVTRRNVDLEKELELSVDKMPRILRGKGALQYVGHIHEFTQATDPKYTKRAQLLNLILLHSGYSSEIRQDKLLRNKALLEAALPEQPDGVLKALYHYYLMRENYGIGDIKEALCHLLWLQDNQTDLRKFMRTYQQVGENFPYQALNIALRNRGSVSRRQLRGAIVDTMVDIFKKHPSSLTFPIHYDAVFYEQDGALLKRMDAAFEKAEAMRGDEDTDMDEYLKSCAFLYSVAGDICWRRGDREASFDYASRAVRFLRAFVSKETVDMLLRAVKGLPFADIVLFLNSVMDTSSKGILEMLVATLQHEGYMDLYTYYIKKMLDMGIATNGSFWYLMIVLGKYEEACTAAMEAKDTVSDIDVVQRTLFFAAACSGSKELFEQYKEEMGFYREALDLMFNNVAPDKVNFGTVISNYQLVAFAGGRPAANRLADVFHGFEKMAFQSKANYYYSCGLYAEFLEENSYTPPPEDTMDNLLLAEFEMMCGNTANALEILYSIVESANLSVNFFNVLDALIVRANPEVAAQARALYGAYHPMYQEFVDYLDVVGTGVVLEPDSKKQRKALAELDPAGFGKRIVPAEVAPFRHQLNTLRDAAGVFAKKKSYVAAVDCLTKSLSLGDTSPMTYTVLAEIFMTLENEPLADWLREQADAMVPAEAE